MISKPGYISAPSLLPPPPSAAAAPPHTTVGCHAGATVTPHPAAARPPRRACARSRRCAPGPPAARAAAPHLPASRRQASPGMPPSRRPAARPPPAAGSAPPAPLGCQRLGRCCISKGEGASLNHCSAKPGSQPQTSPQPSRCLMQTTTFHPAPAPHRAASTEHASKTCCRHSSATGLPSGSEASTVARPWPSSAGGADPAGQPSSERCM